jgi:hypothetical protein
MGSLLATLILCTILRMNDKCIMGTNDINSSEYFTYDAHHFHLAKDQSLTI